MDVFNNLTKLLKKYSNILIMTHKYPDLDGFGSAICLDRIIKSFGIKCSIYLDTKNLDISISKAIAKLDENNNKIDFIGLEKRDIITKDTLLLITDVYKKELLEFPEVLEEIEDVIVLDHHVIGNSYIEKTIFSYVDSNLSSMNELMVNYLNYLDIKIDDVVSTIMLAGMDIDTNGFNIKTTKNTFLSAAFLMENGADNVLRKELLKESKEQYIKKQYFIRKSYMVNENTALCVLDYQTYDNKFLAMLADELLQFENVEVAFTIGKIDDNVIGISSRSIGNIDVEPILSKLGGGGHKTNAACQLPNITIEMAKEKLLEIIKE